MKRYLLFSIVLCVFGVGCLTRQSKQARIELPGDTRVKIESFKQLSFLDIKEGGQKLVLADFRVTFVELSSNRKHTQVIRDVVSSFPSGPVSLLEKDRVLEYTRLIYWEKR